MAGKLSYIAVVVQLGDTVREPISSVASQEFDYLGAAKRWAAQVARNHPEDDVAYIVHVTDGWAGQLEWAYIGSKWRDALTGTQAQMPAFVECMARHGVGVAVHGLSKEDTTPGTNAPLTTALKCSDLEAATCTLAKADAKAKGIDLDSISPPASEPVAVSQVYEKLPGVAIVDGTTEGLTADLTKMGFGKYPKQFGGRGVVVAVLDTGCRRDVKELGDRVIGYIDATGQDSRAGDGNGHGTFVATQIAGVLADGTQIGGAPGASLLVVKVLTNAGWGTDTMIARGIWAAINAKAHVITMSLGGSGPMPQAEEALYEAQKRGIIITAACGNDGAGSGVIGFPARYKSCVAIGSCDDSLSRSSFSQTSPDTDLYTLGSAQLGIAPGGKLERWSGTSMATPHAAAFAACLTEQVLTQGGKPIEDGVLVLAMVDTDTTPGSIRGVNPGDTAGFIQVPKGHEALAQATPPSPPPPTPPDRITLTLGTDPIAEDVSSILHEITSAVDDAIEHGVGLKITISPQKPGTNPAAGGKHEPAPTDKIIGRVMGILNDDMGRDEPKAA